MDVDYLSESRRGINGESNAIPTPANRNPSATKK